MRDRKKIVVAVVNALLLIGAMVGGMMFFGRECEGHFYFWYGSTYWEGSWGYFCEHLRSGGVTEWIGNGVALCYKWKWAGAAVMAACVGCVMGCNMLIVKRLWMNEGLMGSAAVSGALMGVMAMNKLFFVGEVLVVVMYYLLLLGYCLIKEDRWRWGVGMIGAVVAYFLLPSGVELLLYGTIGAVEVWMHKGRLKEVWKELAGVMGGYAMIVLLLPVAWKMWVMDSSVEGVYGLGVVFGQKELKWLMVSACCLPMALIVAGTVVKRDWNRWVGVGVYAVLCLIGAWVVKEKNSWESDKNFELFFKVERATVEEDWDEVIRLTEGEKVKANRLLPYAVVAHGMKGDLGDVMFDYPVSAKKPFLPASTHKNVDVECNVAYYKGIGMLNEAIAYEFQNGSIRLNAVDIFTLKQLARLNVERGNRAVAEKYLCALERVGTEREWVNEWRSKKVEVKELEIPEDSVLFFVTGNKEAELCGVLLYEPGNRVALDFLLCSLLRMRDYDNFVRYFFKYYPYKEVERLPRAYEEFLVMAPYANMALPENDFRISEVTRRRFEEFYDIYRSGADAKTKEMRLRALSNSWFCYATQK